MAILGIPASFSQFARPYGSATAILTELEISISLVMTILQPILASLWWTESVRVTAAIVTFIFVYFLNIP